MLGTRAPGITHPGQDPNWKPTNYRWISEGMREIHRSCVPTSDQAALDYFEFIERHFGDEPMYLQARRPDSDKWMLVPWIWEDENGGIAEEAGPEG